MAHSLAEEVEATRKEIATISSGLDEDIRRVHAGAAQAVVDLVRASADRKASLLVRLLHLEAAVAAAGVSNAPTATPTQPGQKGHLSATDAILMALSKKSLSANEVDRAVMSHGLSKSSSEKAKWVCRSNGWVTHSKRVWSITPKGLAKIRGQDPPPET